MIKTGSDFLIGAIPVSEEFKHPTPGPTAKNGGLAPLPWPSVLFVVENLESDVNSSDC